MLSFKEYSLQEDVAIQEATDELGEALTMQQRMKAKQSFRKNKAKIKAGKRKAKNKIASPDKLKTRARKQARNEVEKKILKDKNKADLSFSARQALEKRVDAKKAMIDRIAKKQLPKTRKAELEKKRGGAKKEGVNEGVGPYKHALASISAGQERRLSGDMLKGIKHALNRMEDGEDENEAMEDAIKKFKIRPSQIKNFNKFFSDLNIGTISESVGPYKHALASISARQEQMLSGDMLKGIKYALNRMENGEDENEAMEDAIKKFRIPSKSISNFNKFFSDRSIG
jgi:hypothetical protein